MRPPFAARLHQPALTKVLCLAVVLLFSGIRQAFPVVTAVLQDSILKIDLDAAGDQAFLERIDGNYSVSGTGLAPVLFPRIGVSEIVVTSLAPGFRTFEVTNGPIMEPLTVQHVTITTIRSDGQGPAILNSRLEIFGLAAITADIYSGTQTYHSPVLIEGECTLGSPNAFGEIVFHDTVGGTDATSFLRVSNDAILGAPVTPLVRFGGTVGPNIPATLLGGLDITADRIEINGEFIRTRHASGQTYNGAVVLAAHTEFHQMVPGNIRFNSTLDGPHNATFRAAGGKIIFNAPLGVESPLASLHLLEADNVVAEAGAGIQLDGSLPGAREDGLFIAAQIGQVELAQPGSLIAGFTGNGAGINIRGDLQDSLIAGFTVRQSFVGLVIGEGDYAGTKFADNDFQACTAYGVLLAPENPETGIRNLLFGGDPIEDRNFIVGNQQHGMFVGPGNYTGTRIAGNLITDNADGLRLFGPIIGLTVESNTLAYNSGAGITTTGGLLYNGTAIRANSLEDNAIAGMLMNSTRKLSLGGNTHPNNFARNPVVLVGAVELTDDFRVDGTPDLIIRIAGTDANSFGSIETGTAQLGNIPTIQVQLTGGFSPAPNDPFQIVKAGAAIIGLPQIQVPMLPGMGWFVDDFPEFGRIFASLPVAPQIDSAPPGNVDFMGAFAHQFEADGGTLPFLWIIAEGELPPGVTLDPDTGLLAGIPTQAGRYTGKVRVANQAVPAAEQEFDFSVLIPAVDLTGRYHGVLFDPQANDYPGGISMQIDRRGRFTATMRLAGVVLRGRGELGDDGAIVGTWSSRGRPPVVEARVDLAYALEGDYPGFSGAVDFPGNPIALFAGRVLFDRRDNPLPDELQGSATIQLAPQNPEEGAGWAVGRLRSDGTVRMAGRQGDGTRFSSTTPVQGTVTGLPDKFLILLTQPLYRGNGYLNGIFTYLPQPPGAAQLWTGKLDWLAPPSKRFPAGINIPLGGAIAGYERPVRGQPALAWPVDIGEVEIRGGQLPAKLDARIAIDDRSRFTTLPPNDRTVHFQMNPGNGTVRGWFLHPALNQRVPFHAVADQKNGTIHGFFLEANGQGSVTVLPMPAP